MKRKFFAAFLSLCMVMSLVPMTALAAGTTDCTGGNNCTHAAAIGSTHYNTLSAAISAVTDGTETEIRLLDNITEAVTIPTNKNITLDLAGYTLKDNETAQGDNTSADDRHHTITNEGKLTIVDSSSTKTGKVDNVSHGRGALVNNGTATLMGGTFTRSEEASKSPTDNGGNSWYVIDNHGTMTINGATVSNNSKLSSLVRNASEDSKEVSLTISSGLLENDFIAVKNEDETLTVTGGEITSKEQSLQNWGTAGISGGTFTGPVITWSFDNNTVTTISGQAVIEGDVKAVQYEEEKPAPTVKITGGTITGTLQKGTYNKGVVPVEDSSPVANFEISGGSFSEPVPTAFCEGTSVPLTQESGKYTVISKADAEKAGYPQDSLGNYYESEKVAVENNVASVTNAGGTVTYYATLQEAIEKVGGGDTITLLKDIPDATGITVSSGKNFTIDFGGHTYTLSGPGAGSTNTETNGFQLLKDSTITFKNGTIRITENATNIKRIIQNYANLTLEDMHIYAENQVGGEDYALSFNCGSISFKGDTDIITSDKNTIAFDVCYWEAGGYTEGVTVTFDETYTGTINGKIIYDSTDSKKAKLTIHGTGYIGAVDTSDSTTNGTSITVSGGSFGESVAQYVADALNYEANANGIYTYHKTLDEALAVSDTVSSVEAAKDGANAVTVTVKNGNDETKITLKKNDTYKLPTLPNQGYNRFQGWRSSVNGEVYPGGQEVTISADTTFTAQWSYIPPANPNYKITIGDMENGTVTANPTAAKAGATVTLTPVPDEGYALSTLTVTDRFGDAVRVTEQADGTYTFTMPNGQVTVTATFVQVEEPAPTEPFVDVAEGDWFYDAVVYAYQNELMDGVGGNRFAPNSETTRAQLVTILYRLEGQPAVSGDLPFTDVETGIWYTDAILWAAQNNIVNGVSDTEFAPGDDLTRQQLVTILYRYAESKGYDVSASADLSGYPDADQVQDYAQPAMAWAVAENIIQGMEDGTLKPAGNASRAQIATILMRFCEDVAQ